MLFANAGPTEEFYADLAKAREKYRGGVAKLLKTADRVVVYLLNFESVKQGEKTDDVGDTFALGDEEEFHQVLQSKELEKESKAKMLEELTKKLSAPRDRGGVGCHFPIHGIRIFKGNDVIFETTFCWVCGNFPFRYPSNLEYQNVTVQLETLFNSLLPIPQTELDRFKKKYPGAAKIRAKE